MHPELHSINALYISIENFFDVSVETLLNMEEEERKSLIQERESYKGIYKAGIEQLRAILPLLSHEEILEGYHEGCTLLQRGLSGYMCQEYNAIYLPTMVRAIQDEKEHVAPHFLQAIVDQIGEASSYLVITSLKSSYPSIRRTALSAVDQLSLREAIPAVKFLMEDKSPGIGNSAKRILEKLSKE